MAASVQLEQATKLDISSCKFPPTTVEYTFRDAILYALGIGFSTQDDGGLRYLYENSKDFQVFPLYGVMLTVPELQKVMKLPSLNIDLAKILHLEQFFELHRPLPTQDKITMQMQVMDVLDRVIGSQYIIRIFGSDEKGLLFSAESSIFISGDGKFGGRRSTNQLLANTIKKPERSHDDMLEYKIGIDQPAIFRLSGDLHPLHIEPAVAKSANFDGVIVHGNCTLGIAAQLILKKYANSDVRRFKAVMVRFANVVYPGETLQVYTWKENNRIQFEAKSKESDKAVLTGGWIDLREELKE